MSELRRHAEDYLRLRRALGFKLTLHGPLLAQFIDNLDAAGAPGITTELAVSFAQLPPGVQPIVWAHRLSMVRGFARYLQAIDPATEVPPHDVFAPRYQRPTPYLWQETEVLDLMAAARQLRPALCALTYETFFGLLWCSGMRIGETIGLRRGDVDLSTGVITVRQAKFGRSRLIPLQQSTTDALACYAASRDRLCPQPRSHAFFISSRGTTLIPKPRDRPSTDSLSEPVCTARRKGLVSMISGTPLPCVCSSPGTALASTSRRAWPPSRRIWATSTRLTHTGT